MNIARLFSYTRQVETQLEKAESRIAELEKLAHEQQNYILFLMDRPPLEAIQPKPAGTVSVTPQGFHSLAQLRKRAAVKAQEEAQKFMESQKPN